MTLKEVVSECVQYGRIALAGATIVQFAFGGMFAPSLQAQEEKTASPIKHVIIIVGENRTFDHIFATYKPTNGQTVDNLLSRKIINADGTPGPNFSQAAQIDADPFQRDTDDSSRYSDQPGIGQRRIPHYSSSADRWSLERLHRQWYLHPRPGDGLGERSVPHALPIFVDRRHRTSIPRARHPH